MKTIESYQRLAEFKEKLLASGFLNLSDEAEPADVERFQNIYTQHHPIIVSSLSKDLATTGVGNVTFDQDYFVIEDDHAQGATIIHQTCYIEADGVRIKTLFKYLVFQNIIHCSLQGFVEVDVLNKLTKSSSKLLHCLVDDYKTNKVSHLYELL